MTRPPMLGTTEKETEPFDTFSENHSSLKPVVRWIGWIMEVRGRCGQQYRGLSKVCQLKIEQHATIQNHRPQLCDENYKSRDHHLPQRDAGSRRWNRLDVGANSHRHRRLWPGG